MKYPQTIFYLFRPLHYVSIPFKGKGGRIGRIPGKTSSVFAANTFSVALHGVLKEEEWKVRLWHRVLSIPSFKPTD